MVAQGKRNQSQGVRFERAVARRIRALGWTVRRVCEWDGFTHGIDLLVFSEDGYLLPIAIQVKATASLSDTSLAYRQARAGWPSARFHFGIHSFRRLGSPLLRLCWSGPGLSAQFSPWSDFDDVFSKAASASLTHLAINDLNDSDPSTRGILAAPRALPVHARRR